MGVDCGEEGLGGSERRVGGRRGCCSSLQDSLAPATGGHNVWGGRGVERGGRGLRGSEGFLAVRLVSVVCPSAAWPSSPLRTAPVGHHKRQI